MQKILIAIIVAAAAGIAYTMVTSFSTPSAPEPTLHLSVRKTSVNYGDQETWTVKGLPPGADYLATLRLEGVALIIGQGTADPNGEASGSFGIGNNIPLGTVTLKAELASDATKFDEVLLNIVP